MARKAYSTIKVRERDFFLAAQDPRRSNEARAAAYWAGMALKWAAGGTDWTAWEEYLRTYPHRMASTAERAKAQE